MTTDDSAGLRRVVKDAVVEHTHFTRVMGRLERLLRDAAAGIPHVQTFTGETGTGKTTAIRLFEQRHPRSRRDDGLCTPVVALDTPAKPTPRAIGERLLQKLGDPTPSAGSAAAKMDRSIKMIGEEQALAILFDNAHRFVDKRQNIAIFEVSDYLSELVSSVDVALCFLGLPEVRILIHSNEQLKTRNKDFFEIARFDWRNKESQDQFVGVLGDLQKVMQGFDVPDLTSPELSLRMYLATGGLIRYVSNILTTAIGNALDRNTTTITIKDLESAWEEELVGAHEQFPDPFERDYIFSGLADKVARAKTIGQRVMRPKPSRDRKPSAVLSEIGL